MSNQSDLAFLRDVASSGQHAPSLSGRHFLWWGGLATPALLGHWAIISGLAGIPVSFVGFVWMAYGIIGLIGSGLLAKSLHGKPGTGAVNNRAEAAAWRGVTWTVTAYALGAVLAMALGRGDPILFDTIPLVAFGAYGLSFSVTAQLGGARWMHAMAILSWLASGIGLKLVGTPGLYLFAAAAVGLLAIIPGVVLLRQEPAAEAG